MPSWVAAFLFAVLVVTIPYTMIFRILLRLPKPTVLSHRKWPTALNITLAGAITAYVTTFIHAAYYVRGRNPDAVLMEFVIAGVAYTFGLVMLIRQFSGVYPEFIVTSGTSGLGIRKVSYRNIVDVQEMSRTPSETKLRIHTTAGGWVSFVLPTRSVPVFHECLRASQPPD